VALSGIKSIGRSRLERFRSETGDVVVSLFQKDPQEKKIMLHEKITWKKQKTQDLSFEGIRKPRCMRTLFTKAQGIWKKIFCPGQETGTRNRRPAILLTLKYGLTFYLDLKSDILHLCISTLLTYIWYVGISIWSRWLCPRIGTFRHLCLATTEILAKIRQNILTCMSLQQADVAVVKWKTGHHIKD